MIDVSRIKNNFLKYVSTIRLGQLSEKPWYGVAVLAIGIVAVHFPVIGFVFLWAWVIRKLKISSSYLEGAILGFVIANLINAFVYEALGLLSVNTSMGIVGICYTIFAFLFWPLQTTNVRPLFRGQDIASLLVAVIAFGILLHPILYKHAVPVSHTESTLHLLTSGEDNASHYALFKYAYIHENFAYLKGSKSLGIIKDLANYPQTSNFNMGWLAKSILGVKFINKDKVLIHAYYLLCSVNFCLFVYFICSLAANIFKRLGGTFSFLPGTVLVLLGTCLISIGPLLQLMGRGFHSQIAAYVYFIALLLVILSASERSKVKQGGITATLLFAGICSSWWYLAPVAGLPLLYYFYQNKDLIFQKIYLLGIAIVAVLGFVPVIIAVLAALSSGQLNAAGGVDAIAPVTIIFYLLGVSFCIFYSQKQRQAFRPIIISFLAWLVFTFLVGMYQKITLGHFAYYYYKSIYTLVPLSAIIVILSGLSISSYLTRSLGKGHRVIAAVMTSVAVIATLIALKPVYPQVYVHDWFNNKIPLSDFDPIFAESQRTRYRDLIYVGGCSGDNAYLDNRFSGAILQTDDAKRSELNAATLKTDNSKVLQLLKRYKSDGTTTYVYAIPACLDKNVAEYVRANFSSNLQPLPTINAVN